MSVHAPNFFSNRSSTDPAGFQRTGDPVGPDPASIREFKRCSWHHHSRSYNPGSPAMGDRSELSSSRVVALHDLGIGG